MEDNLEIHESWMKRCQSFVNNQNSDLPFDERFNLAFGGYQGAKLFFRKAVIELEAQRKIYEDNYLSCDNNVVDHWKGKVDAMNEAIFILKNLKIDDFKV